MWDEKWRGIIGIIIQYNIYSAKEQQRYKMVLSKDQIRNHYLNEGSWYTRTETGAPERGGGEEADRGYITYHHYVITMDLAVDGGEYSRVCRG